MVIGRPTVLEGSSILPASTILTELATPLMAEWPLLPLVSWLPRAEVVCDGPLDGSLILRAKNGRVKLERLLPKAIGFKTVLR